MPTMLKMIRAAGGLRGRSVRLRTIFTGGEPAGEEILRWTQEALGVMPNEGYGQTEMNLVLGNSAPLMPVKPGSMGRPVPGHVVDVVDEAGRPVPPGEVGEVAVQRPDPVMFLGYWDNPRATEDKFVGDWALSGDLARRDQDGYFWVLGRKDDVISSGGYRIGPGEIEDCLTAHPAVALAAAVGKPDPLRGEVVKAFVQLREGVPGTPDLARELQAWVRERLSAHEYPREVEFIPALPTTTTGKVKRGDLRSLERSRTGGGAAPGR
jgi:acetyl-CoA synthetase